MRINNNCLRDLMKYVETLDYDEKISIEDLQDEIKNYSINDVMNCCYKLRQDKYIRIFDEHKLESFELFRNNEIIELTIKGVMLLDPVRDDNMWAQTNEKYNKDNDLSIFTLSSLAYKDLKNK
jgi:Hypothetical protein (DUF2513).